MHLIGRRPCAGPEHAGAIPGVVHLDWQKILNVLYLECLFEANRLLVYVSFQT